MSELQHSLPPGFFTRHTATALMAQSDCQLALHGRLTAPVVYDCASDKYLPICWADAFKMIANQLNALDRPGQAVFHTGGRIGSEVTATIQGMLAGDVRVFIGLGDNFIAAAGNAEQARQGLAQCDLTVHVATRLARAHLAHGRNALILPRPQATPTSSKLFFDVRDSQIVVD